MNQLLLDSQVPLVVSLLQASPALHQEHFLPDSLALLAVSLPLDSIRLPDDSQINTQTIIPSYALPIWI